MKELIKYIKKVLDEDVLLQPLKEIEKGNIPMFMNYEYDFFAGVLMGSNVVFMCAREENDITPSQYVKQTEIATQAFNMPVILVVKNVQSFNRLRLINSRVNFIIPGNQLFLPGFLMDLRETFIVKKENTAFIKPSTQLLLLYHILVEPIEKMNFKTIAKKLAYSTVAVTYAMNELVSHQICKVEGAKEKFIVFGKDNKGLWDMVEPLMTSPVQKIIYTDDDILNQDFRITNINALSHYTNIASEKQDYFAISKQKHMSLKLWDTGAEEGKYCLEIWKYDPKILTKNDYVDPLSLYLIFRNDKNERIEAELTELINKIQW